MSQVNLAKEFDLSNQPHDLEWMMAETRRRQSEDALKLCGQALRQTGLKVIGGFVKQNLVDPLRLAMLRRRTLADLRQLDDRMLADIGIERADMVTMVDTLVALEKDAEPKAATAEPLAAQCPTTGDEVEVVAPVTSLEPKAAANSNAAAHRAA